MNIAIIFAGGIGKRLNDSSDSLPKQFIEINNKPILIHTLEIFQKHPQIDKIYVSILKDYKSYTEELIKKFKIDKVAKIVEGGSIAQESIYNALIVAAEESPKESIVLIHDGVRPVITDKVISDNIKCVETNGNAITSTPCYETILISSDGKTPKNVPIRKETFAAQAPQSFRLKEIVDAHEKIRKTVGYDDIVDSCTLFNKLGYPTYLVQGNFGNIKITTPQDVYILKGILDYKKRRGRG